MKFKLKNNKLRIVAATSVTIFSLAVAFTGVYAWFSINKAINGDGERNTVTNVTGKLKSVTFHRLLSKVTDSDGIATSFTFYKNASGTITYNWSTSTGTYVPATSGDTRIQLDSYEPIDQEHPILLLFEFNGEYNTSLPENNIEINATSRTGDFLGARDAEHDNVPVYDLATDIYKTIDGKPYYGLSSIAYFYKKAMSQSAFNTFNDGISYTLTKSELTVANRFTTVDNEAETSSFQRQITIDKENSGGVKYIALVIDYYIDAIEFIYSTYLGDHTLEGNTYNYSLNFICDWTMEVY